MNIQEIQNSIGKREIKFRAWAHYKMIYALYEITPKVFSFDAMFRDGIGEEYDYIPMQYTGLKDKNGKEIYEGDIVRWSDGERKHPINPRIAIVEFSPELSFYAVNCTDYEGTGKYGCKEGYGRKFGYSNFIYTETEKYLEVIGNIFENPELLG